MARVQFELRDEVTLVKSGEKGEVIGVAEYSRHPPSFLVEYVAADGRLTSAWFDAEALFFTNPERVVSDRATRRVA